MQGARELVLHVPGGRGVQRGQAGRWRCPVPGREAWAASEPGRAAGEERGGGAGGRGCAPHLTDRRGDLALRASVKWGEPGWLSAEG